MALIPPIELGDVDTSSPQQTPGTRSRGHSGTRQPKVSSYAVLVRDFSRLPMGIGENHTHLANFLLPLVNSNNSTTNPSRPPSGPTGAVPPFLTLYRFQSVETVPAETAPASALSAQSTQQRWELSEAQHFQDHGVYFEHEIPSKSDSPSLVLFLRGFPSPEWLGAIGAKHRVDSEMFSRWLDFRAPNDHTNNFSRPPLPSTEHNLIELPLITIGSFDSMTSLTDQAKLESARRDWATALRRYHDDLGTTDRPAVGTSVVRAMSLFDSRNFSMEQRITICLKSEEDSKGRVLLVWVDAGEDFGKMNGEPWSFLEEDQRPKGVSLYPIIRYLPNMGLKARSISKGDQASNERPSPTASQLHLSYGRLLKPYVMADDPFYALDEVFTLSAASQKQFLNLVEHKLDQYMAKVEEDDADGLPNLRYLKHILLRQLKQIKAVRDSIRYVRPPKWPASPSDTNNRAREAREFVEEDFAHLHQYAEALSNRCQEAITDLNAGLSILESKRAILQGGRVERLTLIASIFVPLSFSTSFFGMNLRGFDAIVPWAFVAVSVPLMILAMVLFYYDLTPVWAWIRDNSRRVWQKIEQQLR